MPQWQWWELAHEKVIPEIGVAKSCSSGEERRIIFHHCNYFEVVILRSFRSQFIPCKGGRERRKATPSAPAFPGRTNAFCLYVLQVVAQSRHYGKLLSY